MKKSLNGQRRGLTAMWIDLCLDTRRLVLVLALLLVAPGSLQAVSILEWNTAGNLGTETTEPSTFNATNIAAANLTLGSVTPAANGNRFGGNNWWDTGDSTSQTEAQAIAGNDYIQFIVTPDAGFKFSATGFDFIWGHSGTGPNAVSLRSSADGFAANLATASALADSTTTFTNLSFTLSDITAATTFRLYGYGSGNRRNRRL